MLTYSLAEQLEDRATIAAVVLVQEMEGREEVGMYCAQDATFLSSEPLHNILFVRFSKNLGEGWEVVLFCLTAIR
jgi:hypothetical protein